MMHKAWSSIEDVPYCFSRSSVKFQGHTGQKKSLILAQVGHFRPVTQVEFTDGYEIMHQAWSSIEEVPYCFSRSFVKFQGHTGHKIADFDSYWAFPDCNPSLNSPMVFKWCTKLYVVLKRCPIVFWGHPSRSHRLKNQWFESNLNKITRPVAPIKSLRFALYHLRLFMIIWRLFNINIYLFIHLFIIYLFIYLIHKASPVSLCTVEACHLIKLPPVNLSPEAFS